MDPRSLEKDAKLELSTRCHYPRRLRSFVRRGRLTALQAQTKDVLWLHYGLQVAQGLLNFEQVFHRQAPCFLEIGFGLGQSLFALAHQHPDKNFIGIETHPPGIAKLMTSMAEARLTNLKLYEADAVDVLDQCIALNSLAGIQLFFPDPWPKRRHHERRLIQCEFVKKMISKLQSNGHLHLATDWEDYAVQMMQVLSLEKDLHNDAGPGQFGNRSPFRPVITKFERRALEAVRTIRELQFVKN
ncbi:MAG: tRNA (guanosine(46)-N7)-methyltransferase TrmB [Gammaproteobacteria bacterium RIFCSPHIGHO2_12_FULL_42_10]|nr:MAG: tRNA (guanosine(46)-N7)-methyltransferase TrmB [Gammaproteobacteria bacterium RIFCSPHIGHO2_12_FULL_42_10]